MIDGEQVRRRREERGMTQQELAKAAKSSHAAISQVENGKRNPYPGTVRRLAAALGVEVVDLLLPHDPHQGAPLNRWMRRRAEIWDASGGRCYYCGAALHPFRNIHITNHPHNLTTIHTNQQPNPSTHNPTTIHTYIHTHTTLYSSLPHACYLATLSRSALPCLPAHAA